MSLVGILIALTYYKRRVTPWITVCTQENTHLSSLTTYIQYKQYFHTEVTKCVCHYISDVCWTRAEREGDHLSVYSWKMDRGVSSERTKRNRKTREQRKEEIDTNSMQYCANTQYLDRAPQPIGREVRP